MCTSICWNVYGKNKTFDPIGFYSLYLYWWKLNALKNSFFFFFFVNTTIFVFFLPFNSFIASWIWWMHFSFVIWSLLPILDFFLFFYYVQMQAMFNSFVFLEHNTRHHSVLMIKPSVFLLFNLFWIFIPVN